MPGQPQQKVESTPLSFYDVDIESRIGFRPGPFTSASLTLSGLIAAILTVIFYTLLIPISDSYFAAMFTRRGLCPYPTVFLSAWAGAILLLKWRKLDGQRAALAIDLLPSDPLFVLTPQTAPDVLQRLHERVLDPKRFVLFNRVERALSNLRNMGQISEVDSMLRSQADNDYNSMVSSYTVVSGFVWAIPVIGFIGTVSGLSMAVGGFGGILSTAQDLSEIKRALTGVTGGLAVAFETTLIALVPTLAIQLVLTGLKQAEEAFLVQCEDYCHQNIVSRLRMAPTEVREPVA